MLAAWIVYLLLTFLELAQIGGRVTGADGTYILDHYNTRTPDVGYISEAIAARQVKGAYISGAPDLAVEVVSDSNTPTELHQRVGAYLAAGTRIVWVVYPETRTIDIYAPDQDVIRLIGEQVLEGGSVLPGLKSPLTRIFERIQ